MSKIPTAIELTFQKFPKHDGIFVLRNIEEFMIEFAKLHVEAALKEASEKAELEGDEGSIFDYISVDKDSILNAYPLENIK